MLSVIARSSRACIVLLVGLLSLEARSSDQSQSESDLSLARAVELALESNPELKASAYDLQAAQARILQARIRPNPELQAEFENFAGTGETRGTRSLETTLSLSQVIELGDKRRLRSGAAETELDVVSIERRSAQLDVLAQVTTRFIDLVVAQERARFAGEAVQIQRESLNAISKRVQAGRSPEAERSRALIGLTRAQIEQTQALSELQAARFGLSALWGEDQPAFTSASAALFQLAPVKSFAALAQQLDSSAEILLFASQARLREAEVALARAHARPDLTLSIGARRLEASDDAALVASFSIPLPISDRNRGAIREAEVRVAQNEAQRRSTLIQLKATLSAIYQELYASRSRVHALRNEAIPQAQLALEQTRNGYERGRFSFLELSSAQQDLLQLESSAIDAAGDYHRLLAQIERITSAPLTSPLE
jgi:cobalt-zinc-cadmium efflux system outer membrane protein